MSDEERRMIEEMKPERAYLAAMAAHKAQTEALRLPDIPVMPPLLPESATNPARWTYRRLAEYIKRFEGKLDSEHELGARMVSFGQDVLFHVEDMGYYGPDIITFYGTDSKGQSVQLIQHISQLSVLLVAVKKRQEKATRIGFVLDQQGHDAKPG